MLAVGLFYPEDRGLLLTYFFSREFCTMKMEAIRSYETVVLKRPTRRHIPGDEIFND
jgi:hypothetical protein